MQEHNYEIGSGQVLSFFLQKKLIFLLEKVNIFFVTKGSLQGRVTSLQKRVR